MRGVVPHDHGGKFHTRANAELAEDAGDVPLNGAARQVQAGGDGWVGQSFGDQVGHDPFSLGQGVPAGLRAAPGAPDAAVEAKGPQQCLRSCRVPARLHELVSGQRADDRIPGLGHHSRFGQQRHRLFTRLGGEQRPAGALIFVGDLDEPGRIVVGQGLRMPGGAAKSWNGTPRSVAVDAAAYPPGGGQVVGGEGERH